MYAGIGSLMTAKASFADIDFGAGKVDDSVKGTQWDPVVVIQKYINYALGFLFLIMVVMAMYGGWKILTSGAEDEWKEAGKKIIINSVIGIVVIFFAWTITSFLFGFLGQDLAK